MRTLLLLALLMPFTFASRAASSPALISFSPQDFTAVTDTATDSRGNIFICGVTKRPEILPGELIRLGSSGRDDFDAFVIKLRPDGTVAATLLIGGGGYDIAEHIATDSKANVVISGTTSSIDFPVAHALHTDLDASYEPFICKLDSSLQRIVFSTFLNGTYVRGLAVDRFDNILVAGMTGFTTQAGLFPKQNSFLSDVFIAKLDRRGELAYATRLYAGSGSAVSAIAVDPDGVACIAGQASTGDFPLLNAIQAFKPAAEGVENTFLARVDADGTLVSSTFLGSSCGDHATAVTVNGTGEIFVGGVTASENIPAAAPDFSPSCGSLNRGFVIKLGPGATNVIYSTILSQGWHNYVTSIAATPRGGAIVGGTVSSLSGETGVPFLASLATDGLATTYSPNVNCGLYASINHLALKPSGQIVFSGNETGQRFSPGTATYVREVDPSLLRTRQSPAVRILAPHPFHFAPTETLGLPALVSGFEHVDSVAFYDRGKRIGIATNGVPFMIALPSLSPGRHSFTAVARSGSRTASSCPVTMTIGSPRNDDFTNRIRLTGQRLRARGTTLGATAEIDDPTFQGQNSVWYSWRAPQDGAFEFKISDVSFRTFGTVFTGDSLLNLKPRGSFYPWGGSLSVLCRGGETYQVEFASYSSAPANFRFTIRPVERPLNDDFASAELISSVPVTVHGTLAHATLDEGDSNFGPSVWYSWIAPTSGLYLASTDNGLGFVQVLTGTTVSNLVPRGQYIYGLITGSAFYAEAGETYYLSVSPWNTSGAFTLTVAPHEAPPNDNFAQRILIPAGTLSVTGSCIGATSEPGESAFVSPEANTVWWKWIAPASGVYRADVFVPYPRPTISADGTPAFGRPGRGEMVSVYSGGALGALTQENDLYSYSSATWRAEAGTEYQIKIDSGAALLTLEITPVTPPPNDNFAEATLIDGTSAIRGTTEGAGLEAGEPMHGGIFVPNPPRASVWYRWVAPSDDVFVLDTQAGVEVFTGETLTDLVRVTNSTGHLFRGAAGTVYSIAIFDHAYFNSSASFTLRIRVASRPANDDFAQSIPLSGTNFEFTANLRDATVEPNEPDYSYWERPTATVWYSWTAPMSGNFLLGPTNWLGIGVSIYTGDTLTNLTLLAHSYPEADFTALAGTTYYFSIDGRGENWLQPVQVGLRFQTPPPNDRFADRIRLSGTNVTVSGSNIAATVEMDEPAHGTSAAGKSVWYSWTAPQTGRASFELSPTFLAVVTPYTGTDLTNLAALLPLEYYRTKFNLAVQEGVTYQLAVDGDAFFSSASGTFTLNIHYATPPANDAFADRLPIITNQASGALEGASREAGEPDYTDDPLGSSTWWTWTAPSNAVYKVFLQTSESLEAAVFTGNSLATLQKVEPPYSANYFYFAAQTGITYSIQISGRAARYAVYTLTLQSYPPPPNDDFENRSPFTNTVNGTLEGATRQFGEANSSGNTNSGSVWYIWTAPEDGSFDLKETAGAYIISARVYRGDALSNLVDVSLSVDWSMTRFTATAGTPYAIQVADYGTWSGASFTLSMQKSSGAPLSPPIPRSPGVPGVPIATRGHRDVLTLRSTAIETSTNLIDWQLWHSNATQTNWSLPIGAEPQRFYRAR